MSRDAINVYVGTEPKTAIAAEVLKLTIETKIHPRALPHLRVTFMEGPGWEYPLKGIKVGTGFSLRRWMIPAALNWQGGGLYLDADQVVFGDLTELLELAGAAAAAYPRRRPILWTTYQPDKYYKQPAPQTSVMLIDAEAARGKWGFEIDKVLAHLRGHPDKETYAKFMHAEWLQRKPTGPADGYNCFDDETSPDLPHPAKLPVEWNHLNKYVHGKTKLLHYTKEDEQPWYKPDHPLAKHWHKALQDAIDAGRVTQEMLRAGLAAWGKKQDWRPTNGLHPHYRRYLKG